MHFFQGLARGVRFRESYKAEPARPAGVAVEDYLGFRDCAECGKGIAEALVAGCPGQVSYEQTVAFSGHDAMLRVVGQGCDECCCPGGGPDPERYTR